MGRVLRFVAIGIGLAVVLGAAAIVGARFHSGPLGPLPGGAFAEATVPEPLDAASLTELDTVEIEVGVADPRTRTTWVVVHEGVAYVPAGMAESKVWPKQAEADGRLRIRAGGKVHAVSARRVYDEATRAALVEAVGRKYELSGDPDGDLAKGTWFFALGPPEGAAPPDAS